MHRSFASTPITQQSEESIGSHRNQLERIGTRSIDAHPAIMDVIQLPVNQ